MFLWSEGTAQGEVEAALELNFGYPALVALSTEKKVFSTFRGTFSESAVREYLFDLSRGGGNKAPLPDLPNVQVWGTPVERLVSFATDCTWFFFAGKNSL